MINALSVDVEDWYQAIETIPLDSWNSFEDRVERNVDKLLDIFRDARVKATFFVLGWIAERHPKMVSVIKEGGQEIATHGYSHRFIYDLGPSLFREELRRSIRILEDITGERVFGHRASAWTITKDSSWALDILLEENLLYDSSITPIQTYLNGYPGFPNAPFIIGSKGKQKLIEFPLTTLKVCNYDFPVVGGLFSRVYPYWLIRYGINRINQKARPVMFYIHPWDLDTDQPRLTLSLKLKRHYFNLKGTEKKLKSLLRDFKFSTVKDVLINEGLIHD